MRRNIVPGEPGIFPAPFAKWWSRLVDRRRRRRPVAGQDEKTVPPNPDPRPETPKP